ncbi:hypothetical protein GW17_00061238 [Ensete ventricosum]|nr:hypothetical protein GW17_00061238 [Ensete ventricosum]
MHLVSRSCSTSGQFRPRHPVWVGSTLLSLSFSSNGRLPRGFVKAQGRVLWVRSCSKGVIYMPARGYVDSVVDRSGVSVVIMQLSGFTWEAFREVESLLGDTRDCEPLGEAESSLVDAQD